MYYLLVSVENWIRNKELAACRTCEGSYKQLNNQFSSFRSLDLESNRTEGKWIPQLHPYIIICEQTKFSDALSTLAEKMPLELKKDNVVRISGFKGINAMEKMFSVVKNPCDSFSFFLYFPKAFFLLFPLAIWEKVKQKSLKRRVRY